MSTQVSGTKNTLNPNLSVVAGGWNILEEMIFEEWVTASQVYRRSAFQTEQAAKQNICTWCVLDGGTEMGHTYVALILRALGYL